MTIKVERETLLRLLGSPAPPTPLEQPIRCRGEYEYVSIRKPAFTEEYPLGKLRESPEDDDSVYTVSTASLSIDADDVDYDKRVSFAEPLVTEEWSREYTSKDEIADLFYSAHEMQRFRQEYRLERKLLSDLSVGPGDLPTDTEVFSKLVDAKFQAQLSGQGRHQISRVVVLHDGGLETFFSTDEAVVSFKSNESDDFFDSDSFWSGSITWY